MLSSDSYVVYCSSCGNILHVLYSFMVLCAFISDSGCRVGEDGGHIILSPGSLGEFVHSTSSSTKMVHTIVNFKHAKLGGPNTKTIARIEYLCFNKKQINSKIHKVNSRTYYKYERENILWFASNMFHWNS